MIDPIVWSVVRGQLMAWVDEMRLPKGAVATPQFVPPEKIEELAAEIDKLVR